MRKDVMDGMRDAQRGSMPEAELASLVAARICHDLVGPVGAIGNGLDLLRELEAGNSEDLALVSDSADRAAAILKFHRLAFGWHDPQGEAHTRTSLTSRLGPVVGSGRVKLDVHGLDGPGLAPATARLAALMTLAGRALIGLEGRLSVALASDGDLPISLTAESASVRWTPELEALSRGQPVPATPRQVEFALLPSAAAAAGARLSACSESGCIRLNAMAL